MANELGCEYYIFEDSSASGIKKFNYDDLSGFKCVVQPYYLFGKFYWQNDTIRLVNDDYDLVIVGGSYCVAYWPLIICRRLLGRKVASWSHGMYGRETGLRKLVKTWFYKLCDMNFVYNDRAIELMVDCGIDRSRIQKVGNSLDTDHDWKIRKTLCKTDIVKKHFHNNNPTLVFVGRVTKEKRLDMILDAMKTIKEDGIETNLIVVGKDIDEVNLENVASVYGLGKNLFMYGPCYDDAILGELFYNSDLCVSPGNVGLTAVSAMTFGCPVISHSNFSYQGPEYAAIIPGETGDFFEQGNVRDLASVIKKWVSPEIIAIRDEVRMNCYNEIDRNWTIYSETEAFRRGIDRIFK